MEIPNSPDIENPYVEQNKPFKAHDATPRLQNLDNGNAIIIFESSQTGSIEDTLIGARQQWECKHSDFQLQPPEQSDRLTILQRVGDVCHSILRLNAKIYWMMI